ncbi:MAG: esterase-like activity of phytase family protein, partial [Pseudomonadota bacterium]
MRPVLGVAAVLVVAACMQAGAGSGRSKAVDVRATAIEIAPDALDGLTLLGAMELNADHPSFGGFSGLWMEEGRLIAISDVGWFLFAETEARPGGLAPTRARMVQMRGEGGAVFDKRGGDSEGLALVDEDLVISFERDHRLMTHRQGGQLGGTVYHRDWETMSSNKGLEALAALP